MAEVRFYTLSDAAGPARLKKVCALIEQAFRDGGRVLVWLEDAAALAQFDNLLWTFGDRSFVPHEPLAADPAACEAPVQLHAGADLPAAALAGRFSTLVMLRNEAAPAALDFNTIIEVVDADPACRAAGRARFRFYREHGLTPQHIEATT
ncbi:MAG: DNA polymerase III subunit chi [Steroidobacteraceae bacterium]